MFDHAISSTRVVVIGVILTVLWVLTLLALGLATGENIAIPGWIVAMTALTPVILMWLTIGFVRALNRLTGEVEKLRVILDQGSLSGSSADSFTTLNQGQAGTPATAKQPAATTTTTGPAATRKTPSSPAYRPQRHKDQSPPSGTPDPRQSSLGFDAPEPVKLSTETIILALNFPDSSDDHVAIDALREALKNDSYARLIRSAQDVITLLAERGIIVDDLTAMPTDITAWHRFAEGQRGQAVASVGAIRDTDALALVTTTMRNDEIFRDAAHHFLRLFDRSITILLSELNDDEIVYLSEIRSARAFMLLARAAGLFGQEI